MSVLQTNLSAVTANSFQPDCFVSRRFTRITAEAFGINTSPFLKIIATDGVIPDELKKALLSGTSHR